MNLIFFSRTSSPEIPLKKYTSLIANVSPTFLKKTFALSVFISLCTSQLLIQPIYAQQDPILAKAAQALKAGREENAQKIYEAYLASHPNHYATQLELARLAMRAHNFDKARNYLENNLQNNPSDPAASAELGHLFTMWSHDPIAPVDYMARSREHLNQALMLDPNHGPSLTYLGEWFMASNDPISAERYFQASLRAQDDYMPAHQQLAKLYLAQRDLSRARNLTLRALELDPGDAQTVFLMAELLAIADHPAESLKYALKSEQLDAGRSPKRDLLIANQYEKLGELKLATERFEDLADYGPLSSKDMNTLATLYRRQGDLEKSQAYFKRAIAQDPSLRDNAMVAARNGLRSGAPLSSLAQWREVLAMDPTNPEAIYTLLSIHFHHWIFQQSPHPEFAQDQMHFQSLAKLGAMAPMANAKLMLITGRSKSEPVLTPLSNVDNDLIAGEACFLLQKLGCAKERLDFASANNGEEYAHWGDIMMLDGNQHMASIYYQRAIEQGLNPANQQAVASAVRHIKQMESQAEQKVQQGDLLYAQKQYAAAANLYDEASRLNPGLENVYLKMADTYERAKEPVKAYGAYQRAVSLNPGLMSSKGFAKKFTKIEKKALKIKAKTAPAITSQ